MKDGLAANLPKTVQDHHNEQSQNPLKNDISDNNK